MDKTKVAVIGLGGIAQIMHLPALKNIKDVEIVALCDTELGKAKHIAKKYGVKHYTNAVQMISENPELNAVVISAQTDAHLDLSVKCLESGIDIMVEKPIARNLKEAGIIVETAEKNKRTLMVAMNNRFRNDSMLQRSFIRSKEIGEIFYVKTGWLKSRSSSQSWFTEREKSGGGVFIDNGIVMLDLGCWMLGFPEAKSVSAVSYYHNTKNIEDSNFSLIKFKNGAALTIEVSWSFLRGGEFFYCNVFGTEGSSSINPLRIHKNMNNELFDITPKSIKPAANVSKNSFEFQMKYFIGTLRGTNKLVSSGREALTVMKIVDALYRSAKLGKEVILK
ncbi:gfo/Idh/MocA family oxidoreductase [bacterium]|nr:MAG: gfo/Idh/MocA family oxidoreductase [bacterium]